MLPCVGGQKYRIIIIVLLFMLLYSVMPVYHSDLWKYFKEMNRLRRIVKMSTRFKIFESILEGVLHIQNSKIKHLDLKPSNVLIKTDQNDQFDGLNCVITDFGIGGKMDKQTGLRGTPGYASPEQLVSFGVRKSDNYSFGRLMIFIFFDWSSSWTVMYKPVTDADINNLKLPPVFSKLREIIYDLLKVSKKIIPLY